MIFLVASVIVLVGVVVALILTGSQGPSVHLAPATSTVGGRGLPDGPITSDDVAAVRFDTGWRGYRTDQVDAVIDVLTARLSELEGNPGVERTVPSSADRDRSS